MAIMMDKKSYRKDICIKGTKNPELSKLVEYIKTKGIEPDSHLIKALLIIRSNTIEYLHKKGDFRKIKEKLLHKLLKNPQVISSDEKKQIEPIFEKIVNARDKKYAGMISYDSFKAITEYTEKLGWKLKYLPYGKEADNAKTTGYGGAVFFNEKTGRIGVFSNFTDSIETGDNKANETIRFDQEVKQLKDSAIPFLNKVFTDAFLKKCLDEGIVFDFCGTSLGGFLTESTLYYLLLRMTYVNLTKEEQKDLKSDTLSSNTKTEFWKKFKDVGKKHFTKTVFDSPGVHDEQIKYVQKYFCTEYKLQDDVHHDLFNFNSFLNITNSAKVPNVRDLKLILGESYNYRINLINTADRPLFSKEAYWLTENPIPNRGPLLLKFMMESDEKYHDMRNFLKLYRINENGWFDKVYHHPGKVHYHSGNELSGACGVIAKSFTNLFSSRKEPVKAFEPQTKKISVKEDGEAFSLKDLYTDLLTQSDTKGAEVLMPNSSEESDSPFDDIVYYDPAPAA